MRYGLPARLIIRPVSLWDDIEHSLSGVLTAQLWSTEMLNRVSYWSQLLSLVICRRWMCCTIQQWVWYCCYVPHLVLWMLLKEWVSISCWSFPRTSPTNFFYTKPFKHWHIMRAVVGLWNCSLSFGVSQWDINKVPSSTSQMLKVVYWTEKTLFWRYGTLDLLVMFGWR